MNITYATLLSSNFKMLKHVLNIYNTSALYNAKTSTQRTYNTINSLPAVRPEHKQLLHKQAGLRQNWLFVTIGNKEGGSIIFTARSCAVANHHLMLPRKPSCVFK